MVPEDFQPPSMGIPKPPSFSAEDMVLMVTPVLLGMPPMVKGSASKGLTPRAARRQAMREAGIPTSQQPVSQTSTRVLSTNQPGGRQYTYETPTSGGGTRQQSVQHSLTDRVEGHGPHWEAGPVKPRGQTDPLGRPRLQGQKVKIEE